MRNGTPVRGTGFVVGLDRDRVTIVTASHVIEGMEMAKVEVVFVEDPKPFPADVLLGMDAGNPNGLAVFQVRGALPAGLTALSFENERPHLGEALFMLGFPQMERSPRMTQRVLSGRNGTLLLIDQEIGEGYSGGPVLKGGKVVGVVTNMDTQTTYAVNATVARESLEGWGISLNTQSSTTLTSTVAQTKPAIPAVEKCIPREERTEAGIVFVRICPGTFTMGSTGNGKQVWADETPAHKVTLSEYWIGKTEITNKQYRSFRPGHRGEASMPVTGLSWAEAQAACVYFGGRLPTEAEWEYAARAGSQTAWSFGDDEKRLGEYAWYGERWGGTPHPVGKKKPNAWGLYDMHGNVAEVVADWFGTYTSQAQTDPTGPSLGEFCILRGGAFGDSARTLRAACRRVYGPESQSTYFGFRCARSPHGQP
jgi:formylglycine-generating enzyme required for sulfatase activity